MNVEKMSDVRCEKEEVNAVSPFPIPLLTFCLLLLTSYI